MTSESLADTNLDVGSLKLAWSHFIDFIYQKDNFLIECKQKKGVLKLFFLHYLLMQF